MRSIGRMAMGAALALAAAACGTADASPGEGARAGDVAPRVVTVVAYDFGFDAPEAVEAGLVTFRMMNRGPDLHHVQLVKLEGGKTIADLAAADPHGPPPPWVVDVGGPNAAAPGGVSEVTLVLEPGSYALLCFISGPDGKPHLMKGMVKGLTVTGAPQAAAALPPADVTVRLSDYAFAWEGPMTAGEHVVRVRNAAAQSHEIFIARLAPGKSAADVLAWLQEQDGPPPAIPLGGVVGLARGRENVFPVRLEKGRYALFCFIPDAGDGKPHVAHGMMREFEVE
jgi:hypothetical protein